MGILAVFFSQNLLLQQNLWLWEREKLCSWLNKKKKSTILPKKKEKATVMLAFLYLSTLIRSSDNAQQKEQIRKQYVLVIYKYIEETEIAFILPYCSLHVTS